MTSMSEISQAAHDNRAAEIGMLKSRSLTSADKRIECNLFN